MIDEFAEARKLMYHRKALLLESEEAHLRAAATLRAWAAEVEDEISALDAPQGITQQQDGPS